MILLNPQVILLEMAKFEVFTKSSGMRTHIPKALVVTVLGPQNDHNTNAAKSLKSFAKQLEISGVKVRNVEIERSNINSPLSQTFQFGVEINS